MTTCPTDFKLVNTHNCINQFLKINESKERDNMREREREFPMDSVSLEKLDQYHLPVPASILSCSDESETTLETVLTSHRPHPSTPRLQTQGLSFGFSNVPSSFGPQNIVPSHISEWATQLCTPHVASCQDLQIFIKTSLHQSPLRMNLNISCYCSLFIYALNSLMILYLSVIYLFTICLPSVISTS
jgi:hypothetical protein